MFPADSFPLSSTLSSNHIGFAESVSMIEFIAGRTLAVILSVAMPADSRREKIFDFVREFAVKYFRIVPVRDSTQQNKA